MVQTQIFRPSTMGLGKTVFRGKGMGSVLLDGGIGGQSSYNSMEDYKDTVNKSGSGLNDKLASLLVKPIGKKPKNIRF